MSIYCNFGLFFFIENITQRYRRKWHAIPLQPRIKLFYIIICQPNQPTQNFESFIEVFYLLRYRCKVKDWLVFSQQFAATIKDKTAGWWHILRMQAVTVRASCEIFVLIDLEINQLQNKHGKKNNNKDTGNY